MEKVNAEGAKVPRDLTVALKKNKTAWNNFEKFTKLQEEILDLDIRREET